MDNDTWHRMMDAVITQAYLDPESAASPPPAKTPMPFPVGGGQWGVKTSSGVKKFPNRAAAVKFLADQGDSDADDKKMPAKK